MVRPSTEPEIGIWIAEYSGNAVLEPLTLLLSAREREHSLALRSGRRRDEYVIGRAMARTVLGRYLGLTPVEVGIVIEPEGRPRLDPNHGSDLEFSISHTDGMIAVAVSRLGTIGIDVETRSNERDALGLGRRFFHLLEQAYLEAGRDERELQERFLDVWTLKEAYLKAIGTGVRGRLASFGFEFEAPAKRVRFLPDAELSEGPEAWSFEVVHPTTEHVLALAHKQRNAGGTKNGPSTYRCELPGLGERGFERVARWSSAR